MPEKLRQHTVELKDLGDKAGELYRGFFENNHSIMLIIHPENGAIIDANAAACKFYKYPKEKITTLRIMDINICSQEQITEEMQNAKLERRNTFNFKHRLADGEIREVDVFSSPIALAGEKVLYSIILDVTDRKRSEEEREKLIEKLGLALAEIKVLRGILPICSFCKKIRNDNGNWDQIEVYIHDHSEAKFSHSICPGCMKKHYPEVKRRK